MPGTGNGARLFELGGLYEVERQIVGHHSVHRHAYQKAVHDEDEHAERGKDAARCRNGKRAEKIFENQERAGPKTSEASPWRTFTRGAHANLQRKIGRRGHGLHVGEVPESIR